ncbi:MAG: potassium channel family protein [Candidatus Marinimicrobia bacterium]|nr:potassium channel family protein [Candidatus Neomarinimicrobiota bacterium]
MRLWLRTLIRNSFFQIGAGILIVMTLGGLILRLLETGAIIEGENPFWWAIVTMTTVGYGDFAPESTSGRLVSVLVMFAGISLISMLTATISSIFVAKKIREGKGLEKIKVNKHIILCGWNRNGEQIIDSIQYLSDGKLNLVLINELSEEEINRLKSKYQKINLNYVTGDFTQERILEKANVRSAETVVIIPNPVSPKASHPDEKTIFATMTIKSMDSNLRVVAYLHDRDNLKHIRRANVDEVVLSDDFGAYMVASHVMDPGIPQTVDVLLSNKSSTRFKRMAIPAEFIGRTYNELFENFRTENNWVLVGVYSEEEQLGIGEVLSADPSSLDAFIERKLKEGGISLQEESKVSTVINPQKDYIIKDGERAIVIL